MDKDDKKLSGQNLAEGSNSLVEFDFIKDKPHLIYLIKKSEKLAGAVHLVTASLPLEEPLRLKLRKLCLSLLGNILSFERKNLTDASLESTVAECIALLNIGRSSLLISEMNAEVLKREFINLLPILNALYRHEREQVSFDQEAFIVPPVEFAFGGVDDLKGHVLKDNVLYDKKDVRPPQVSKKDSKREQISTNSTRERLILDVIKAKGEVGIKDISTLIHGVSGKTIQRDLAGLVSKGTLRKSGKRRWSRYSLSR